MSGKLKRKKWGRVRERYVLEKKRKRGASGPEVDWEVGFPGQKQVLIKGDIPGPYPMERASRRRSLSRSVRRSRTPSAQREAKRRVASEKSKAERQRVLREAKTLADSLPDRTAQQQAREEELRDRYKKEREQRPPIPQQVPSPLPQHVPSPIPEREIVRETTPVEVQPDRTAQQQAREEARRARYQTERAERFTLSRSPPSEAVNSTT